MRTDSWTAERLALLRQLWEQGATADAIAKQLGGVSRSAVLGKIFRMRRDAAAAAGNNGNGAARAAQKLDSRPKPAANAASARAARAVAEFFARRRGGAPDQTAPPQPAASTRKTLLELTNETCRWPHGRPGGKFFFCGAPEADLERGIPYCERHMRRAYTAPDEVVEAAAKLRQMRSRSATVKSTHR